MSRTVPYVNFPAQFAEERAELMARIEGVFARGDFIGGADIDRFEEEVAAFAGARHAVALGSGTDALIFGMRALGIGPGDEVITPAEFVRRIDIGDHRARRDTGIRRYPRRRQCRSRRARRRRDAAYESDHAGPSDRACRRYGPDHGHRRASRVGGGRGRSAGNRVAL